MPFLSPNQQWQNTEGKFLWLWGQRWKCHCAAYPGRLQLPTTHWLAQNYNITWCGKHMGFNKLPTKVFTHLYHHWWQHYNRNRRTENFGRGSGQFPDIWQTCTEHSQELQFPPTCTPSHSVVANPGHCKHNGILCYRFQNRLLQLTVNWNQWTKPGQTRMTSVKGCSYRLQCRSPSIEFRCSILTSLVTCLLPNSIQDGHTMFQGSKTRHSLPEEHVKAIRTSAISAFFQ